MSCHVDRPREAREGVEDQERVASSGPVIFEGGEEVMQVSEPK